jgi:hypothetical protein
MQRKILNYMGAFATSTSVILAGNIPIWCKTMPHTRKTRVMDQEIHWLPIFEISSSCFPV